MNTANGDQKEAHSDEIYPVTTSVRTPPALITALLRKCKYGEDDMS